MQKSDNTSHTTQPEKSIRRQPNADRRARTNGHTKAFQLVPEGLELSPSVLFPLSPKRGWLNSGRLYPKFRIWSATTSTRLHAEYVQSACSCETLAKSWQFGEKLAIWREVDRTPIWIVDVFEFAAKVRVNSSFIMMMLCAWSLRKSLVVCVQIEWYDYNFPLYYDMYGRALYDTVLCNTILILYG